MEEFIEALEKNIRDGNWYGAIFLCLTLPDICGKIEFPGKSSSRRYSEWFERYVQPKYTRRVGPPSMDNVHTFLSGNDCYALRCALLHEGVENIGTQKAQEALESFHFTTPPENGCVHMNQVGSILQLQIDEFANDVIAGIQDWLGDISADEQKQSELAGLMKVHGSHNF